MSFFKPALLVPIIGLACTVIGPIGCGSGDATTAAPATQAPADVGQGSSGSAAVGVAADIGVQQLYGGSGALAYRRPLPSVNGMWDGDVGPASIEGVASAIEPPTPSSSNVNLIPSMNLNATFTAGAVNCEMDTTGLPAAQTATVPTTSWFHIGLTFAGSSPFTVRDDNGATAQITSGELDLYVHDQVTFNDHAGNWTRSIDIYSMMPVGNPLTVVETAADNTSRTVTITGQRHAHRVIVHKRDAIANLVTGLHLHTVDGDFSGYPTFTSGGIASPGNGPAKPDTGSPAATRYFTQWTNTVSNAPVFVWNRYATFAVEYTHPIGSSTVTTVVPGDGTTLANGDGTTYTVSANESIYVTRNGTITGPFTLAQLLSTYGQHIKYDQAGAHL